MDLNEISVFIQVVQSGSFSHAARKLGMPNSTVSSKVSSLEKRLGTTLIQRTTRKLNVTPTGQAYFKRCIQGLEEIQTAEKEIASSQTEPQGQLRITAPVEIGSKVLPDVVSRYIAKFPKVRIELLLTDREVDLIGEGFDLAIRAGELDDSSLIAKKIGVTHFSLFASPKYLSAKGNLSHPRELRQHNCLVFTPIGIDEWRLVGAKGALNIPISSRVIVNDLMMLKALAARGDGIVYLPAFLVRKELALGKLIHVLPEWRSDLNPVHFVYPSHRFVAPKLSAFMSVAMETLKESFE